MDRPATVLPAAPRRGGARRPRAAPLAAALALPISACAHFAAAGRLEPPRDRRGPRSHDNTLLPVYVAGGERWIVGTPGHEYAIRIRNHTGTRILAVPSVDGVNAITGETASPDQSGYVLEPYGSVEIAGWRKSLSHTAAFYFTNARGQLRGAHRAAGRRRRDRRRGVPRARADRVRAAAEDYAGRAPSAPTRRRVPRPRQPSRRRRAAAVAKETDARSRILGGDRPKSLDSQARHRPRPHRVVVRATRRASSARHRRPNRSSRSATTGARRWSRAASCRGRATPTARRARFRRGQASHSPDPRGESREPRDWRLRVAAPRQRPPAYWAGHARMPAPRERRRHGRGRREPATRPSCSPTPPATPGAFDRAVRAPPRRACTATCCATSATPASPTSCSRTSG